MTPSRTQERVARAETLETSIDCPTATPSIAINRAPAISERKILRSGLILSAFTCHSLHQSNLCSAPVAPFPVTSALRTCPVRWPHPPERSCLRHPAPTARSSQRAGETLLQPLPRTSASADYPIQKSGG